MKVTFNKNVCEVESVTYGKEYEVLTEACYGMIIKTQEDTCKEEWYHVMGTNLRKERGF